MNNKRMNLPYDGSRRRNRAIAAAGRRAASRKPCLSERTKNLSKRPIINEPRW